jgi:hypothetical protein
MDLDSNNIQGHPLVSLERYRDSTRHMIEFDVMRDDTPFERTGQRMRLFLSDDGYTDALERQNHRQIKIRRYAHVMGGNIIYERKKKKRRR